MIGLVNGCLLLLAAFLLLSATPRLHPRFLLPMTVVIGGIVLAMLPGLPGILVAAGVAVPAFLAGLFLEHSLLRLEVVRQDLLTAQERAREAESEASRQRIVRVEREQTLAGHRGVYGFSRQMATVLRLDEFMRVLVQGLRNVVDYRGGILAIFPGETAHPGSVIAYDVDRAEALPEGTWPSAWKPQEVALAPARVEPDPVGGAIVTLALEAKDALIGALWLRGARRRGAPDDASEDPAAVLPPLNALRAQASLGLRKVLFYRRVVAMSRTDATTGLSKRWFFMERLQEEIRRAAEEKSSLTLVMADVDEFKRVNDRFGHLVGDAVLSGVSATVQIVLRREDLAGRYGGDEIVMAFPRTAGPAARVVCERVRERLRALRIGGVPESERVALSFGLATYPEEGDSPRGLIEAADRRLYEAKRAGRNRVIGGEAPAGGLAGPSARS
ncbi:MAG: GGDEF domain-containing protein [Planctomycetota bacterium]